MLHTKTIVYSVLACLLIPVVDCRAKQDCSETIYQYVKKSRNACGRPGKDKKDGYILGGQDVGESEFSFVAHVYVGRRPPNRRLCTGVLISDKHVLTDAWCMDWSYVSLKRWTTIFVPSCALPGRPTERTIHHPDPKYKDTYEIVELRSGESNWACLPTKSSNITTTGPTSRCFQLGRGTNQFVKEGEETDDNVPDYVQKLRVEETPCDKDKFDDQYRCFKDPTGQGAICQGDGGGPTVCFDENNKRWTAIGIAKYRAEDRCKPGGVFGSLRLDTEVAKSLLKQC